MKNHDVRKMFSAENCRNLLEKELADHNLDDALVSTSYLRTLNELYGMTEEEIVKDLVEIYISDSKKEKEY